MSLQNRVTPFGELIMTSARGLFMGNRGGRFHEAPSVLGTRRWSSKQWICCRLEFNNRHRQVWGDGYTELFFLDEVTALAAGHRPCFECRRQDALAFAARFPGQPKAQDMDIVLHSERLDRQSKRLHLRKLDELPDGAMIALNDEVYAVRGAYLLRWSPSGYAEKRARQQSDKADVLTPPAILTVLANGYSPIWHASSNL